MAKIKTAKAVRQQATKARGPKGAPASKWWEQAEEVPRAGLDDAEKIAKSAKRWRRYVKATVVLTPLLMLTTIVAVSRSMNPAPAVVESTVAQYAETKSDAVVEVRKWLAQDPSPLPGAVLVGWNSATTEAYRGNPDDPNYSRTDDYDLELHTLTIASPGGMLYDTTVTLAVNDITGAVVVGEPSLLPRPPSASAVASDPWIGYETVQTSEAVDAAIVSWGNAYSSGDPNALRLAIQDPEELHSYMPLAGATLRDGYAEKAIAISASTIVVKATFGIQWDGVKSTDTLPNVTYDLLIEKANTAAPVVVAWGGSGSGPDLKKYGNAVLGRSIETKAEDFDDNVVGSDEDLPSDTPASTPGKNKKRGKS